MNEILRLEARRAQHAATGKADAADIATPFGT
jgi:hypothetical protein